MVWCPKVLFFPFLFLIFCGVEWVKTTLPHKTFGRACRLVGKSYFQLLNAVFSQIEGEKSGASKVPSDAVNTLGKILWGRVAPRILSRFTIELRCTAVFFSLYSGTWHLYNPPKFCPNPYCYFGSRESGIQQKLPDDLPKAKVLLFKFSPAAVPAERPKEMSRRDYKLLEQHAANYPHANEQLAKAAAAYPYAYRITTQDSTAYYQERGYRYLLMYDSFNSFLNGTFRSSGSNASNPTMVDLYVKDLSNGNKYVVDDFSETFVYYCKGLVGILLERIHKQFGK